MTPAVTAVLVETPAGIVRVGLNARGRPLWIAAPPEVTLETRRAVWRELGGRGEP